MRRIALCLAWAGCVPRHGDAVDISWTDTEADADTDADSDADSDADADADVEPEPEPDCAEQVDSDALAACADGGWAAITAELGYATIQAAIDAAGTGELIAVCPGTWAENLDLGHAQTLAGADPSPGVVVIDAAERVGIDVGSQGATVRGLTVRRGQAESGGGIRAGGELVLECVVLEDNEATNGGAIHASSALTLRDSVVRDNRATLGGAVYAGGLLVVEDCTFVRNSGEYGGAVYAAADATVLRSVFEDNEGDYGSALRAARTYGVPSAVTVEDSAFTGNTSWWSGAIDLSSDDGSTLEVRRTTFTANVSEEAGGAVDASAYGSVALTFTDVTFGGNSGADGGALTLQVQSVAAVTFADTTFEDNVTLEGGGAIGAKAGFGPVQIVADGLIVHRNEGGDGAILLGGNDLFGCTGCDFGAEGDPEDNRPIDLTMGTARTDDLPSVF